MTQTPEPPEPAIPLPPTEARDAGFTLLEILVVIAILGLLIGLVAPAVLRQLGGARNSIAHQSIERLGSVLDLYKLDMGSYPSTEQGLQALVTRPSDGGNWNGPYVKGSDVPVDPWNHPYDYRNPSSRGGHDYDLCSRGAAVPGQHRRIGRGQGAGMGGGRGGDRDATCHGGDAPSG